jgi:hypothetical protein
MEYPAEIQEFQDLLASLLGINDVCSGIDEISDLHAAALCLLEYAHLPIGAMLRSDGGFPNEHLLQFEFTIDGSRESLASLAFLSWFVRDQARGGEGVQLRPFALPPQPSGLQIVDTLKFHIDLFLKCQRGDLPGLLKPVLSLHKALKMAIEIYTIPQKPRN